MAKLNITFCYGETLTILYVFFFTIQFTGRRIIGAPDEKAMDEIMLDTFSYSVGVIFNDSFSYKFKFYHRYYVPILKEDFFTGDFPYKVLCF